MLLHSPVMLPWMDVKKKKQKGLKGIREAHTGRQPRWSTRQSTALAPLTQERLHANIGLTQIHCTKLIRSPAHCV